VGRGPQVGNHCSRKPSVRWSEVFVRCGNCHRTFWLYKQQCFFIIPTSGTRCVLNTENLVDVTVTENDLSQGQTSGRMHNCFLRFVWLLCRCWRKMISHRYDITQLTNAAGSWLGSEGGHPDSARSGSFQHRLRFHGLCVRRQVINIKHVR